MAPVFRILCLVLVLTPAFPALTQEAPEAAPTEFGASGKAYLQSLPPRRIQTDVAYFDPSAPPPALDTQQEPDPVPDESGGKNRDGVDLPTGLIAAAVLLAMVYFFYRFGGGMSVSLRPDAENARRARAGGGFFDAETTPLALKDILRESDRRLALIHLAQKALDASVAASGMLFQRSWTARDALRRLTLGEADQAALRALVLDSERVQFGGRDVSEEEFQSHLSAIRPLIEAQSP